MSERPMCECQTCGRMHWKLGNPPWAPTHEELCRLSRIFNQASDLRTSGDQRINEFLKRLIASSLSHPPDVASGGSRR